MFDSLCFGSSVKLVGADVEKKIGLPTRGCQRDLVDTISTPAREVEVDRRLAGRACRHARRTAPRVSSGGVGAVGAARSAPSRGRGCEVNPGETKRPGVAAGPSAQPPPSS